MSSEPPADNNDSTRRETIDEFIRRREAEKIQASTATGGGGGADTTTPSTSSTLGKKPDRPLEVLRSEVIETFVNDFLEELSDAVAAASTTIGTSRDDESAAAASSTLLSAGSSPFLLRSSFSSTSYLELTRGDVINLSKSLFGLKKTGNEGSASIVAQFQFQDPLAAVVLALCRTIDFSGNGFSADVFTLFVHVVVTPLLLLSGAWAVHRRLPVTSNDADDTSHAHSGALVAALRTLQGGFNHNTNNSSRCLGGRSAWGVEELICDNNSAGTDGWGSLVGVLAGDEDSLLAADAALAKVLPEVLQWQQDEEEKAAAADDKKKSRFPMLSFWTQHALDNKSEEASNNNDHNVVAYLTHHLTTLTLVNQSENYVHDMGGAVTAGVLLAACPRLRELSMVTNQLTAVSGSHVANACHQLSHNNNSKNASSSNAGPQTRLQLAVEYYQNLLLTSARARGDVFSTSTTISTSSSIANRTATATALLNWLQHTGKKDTATGGKEKQGSTEVRSSTSEDVVRLPPGSLLADYASAVATATGPLPPSAAVPLATIVELLASEELESALLALWADKCGRSGEAKTYETAVPPRCLIAVPAAPPATASSGDNEEENEKITDVAEKITSMATTLMVPYPASPRQSSSTTSPMRLLETLVHRVLDSHTYFLGSPETHLVGTPVDEAGEAVTTTTAPPMKQSIIIPLRTDPDTRTDTPHKSLSSALLPLSNTSNTPLRHDWLWALRELFLDYNSLGDGGAVRLATQVLRPGGAPSLVKLGLSDNMIGDAGAVALAHAVMRSPHSRLQWLNLSVNKIGDDGFVAMAKALSCCTYHPEDKTRILSETEEKEGVHHRGGGGVLRFKQGVRFDRPPAHVADPHNDFYIDDTVATSTSSLDGFDVHAAMVAEIYASRLTDLQKSLLEPLNRNEENVSSSASCNETINPRLYHLDLGCNTPGSRGRTAILALAAFFKYLMNVDLTACKLEDEEFRHLARSLEQGRLLLTAASMPKPHLQEEGEDNDECEKEVKSDLEDDSNKENNNTNSISQVVARSLAVVSAASIPDTTLTDAALHYTFTCGLVNAEWFNNPAIAGTSEARTGAQFDVVIHLAKMRSAYEETTLKPQYRALARFLRQRVAASLLYSAKCLEQRNEVREKRIWRKHGALVTTAVVATAAVVLACSTILIRSILTSKRR